ncbi:MAG: flavodoxin family protein [Desulfovibrio sp.]
MKVVAINGSPRKGGNTEQLLLKVLEPIQACGIETELIQIGGKKIHGCRACYQCFEKQDGKCLFGDDILNETLEKIIEADGIILGSPTYFANVSTEMKALIDRAGLVTLANGRMLDKKVGAGVVAVRRAGANQVLDSLNRFFLISGMIIPGSTYWNMGFGREPDEVQSDAEGMANMLDLGRNMAWLLNKIHD